MRQVAIAAVALASADIASGSILVAKNAQRPALRVDAAGNANRSTTLAPDASAVVG